MSLNDEERKTVVRLQLEKAHANFSQIPLLCEAGYWDNVANRLYYALFHAVSALLINDGHEISSHRGAVGAFGQYYVTTGIFSIDDGRHYSRLQGLREKADYNCTYNATERHRSENRTYAFAYRKNPKLHLSIVGVPLSIEWVWHSLESGNYYVKSV